MPIKKDSPINAKEVADRLGLKVNLLWENASPKSQIGEHSISINYSSNKLLMLVFKRDTDKNTDFEATTLISPNEHGGIVTAYNPRIGYMTNRNFYLNKNSILITNGTKQTGFSYDAVDNTVLIIYRIYGIN